jgi:hypothetical protein
MASREAMAPCDSQMSNDIEQNFADFKTGRRVMRGS